MFSCTTPWTEEKPGKSGMEMITGIDRESTARKMRKTEEEEKEGRNQ